jgi:hypothetical protein
MLMPEAQHMHELVQNDTMTLPETGRCQGHHLHPSTAPHTRKTPAKPYKWASWAPA